MSDKRICFWCGNEAHLWFYDHRNKTAGWACGAHWGRYMAMPFQWEWLSDLERRGQLDEAAALVSQT